MTYDEFRDRYPQLFLNPADCPIRVAETEAERQRIERQVCQRMVEQGLPRDWAVTGVVHQDAYVVMLRDPVTFETGAAGTYLRLFERPPDARGAAILPVFEGKAILLHHFRHASRSVHIEVPRGFGAAGLSPRETAIKELAEEIGGECDEILPLGSLVWNSGLSNGTTELFLARLSGLDLARRTEGIVDIRAYDLAEVTAMIADDSITDSFTLACYAKARLKGLI